MKRTTTFLSLLALSAGLLAQSSVKTERQYLSGRGCDDMVQWDFMCTGGNKFRKMDENRSTFLLGAARIRYLSVWHEILW